jgi:hypothetical protein
MHRVALVVLVIALSCGPVLAVGDHADTAVSAVRTGKERLGDKGSDEQRVDDCKVPKEQRTRVRPTDCRSR